MAKENAKKRALSLGDDFGPATVEVNGYKLTIDSNGNARLAGPGDVTIITQGNITAYGKNVTAHTDVNVQLKTPDPEQKNAHQADVTKQAYNVGDVLPDGWVVGPVSPTTGNPIAIEPVSSAPEGYQTWRKGEDHAKKLRSQGHAEVRQPDADELNALYNEVVKAGRNDNAQFNTSGLYCGYWSSYTPDRPIPGYTRVQYFDVGNRAENYKGSANAHVRCVRDEPGITVA